MNQTSLQTLVAPTFKKLHLVRPLVQCLTNEVVQEITANVLLAAGASPAMIIAKEESRDFARIANSVLINLGTPYPERLNAMRAAVEGAREAGHPWVLDPVAAGATPWRNGLMEAYLALRPTVIRGNASEIRALAGMSSSGKGVDSADSSEAAVDAAKQLSKNTGATVFVTGEVDQIIHGDEIQRVEGGVELTTLVVGTGCALSALTATMVAVSETPFIGAVAASYLCKEAATRAHAVSQLPGSFAVAYIDAIHQVSNELNAL